MGGVFEVVATGVPPGLGSHVHWDRKLDGRLAQSLMSIQAMKGVEIGRGFDIARRRGSAVHDEIFYDPQHMISDTKPRMQPTHFYRGSNNSGGLEGGMTTGAPLIVRVAMKPISTLMSPLQSVNLDTKAARGCIGGALGRLLRAGSGGHWRGHRIFRAGAGVSGEVRRETRWRKSPATMTVTSTRSRASEARPDPMSGPTGWSMTFDYANIALTGFMAAGKTVVGRRLARVAGLVFRGSGRRHRGQVKGRAVRDIFSEPLFWRRRNGCRDPWCLG